MYFCKTVRLLGGMGVKCVTPGVCAWSHRSSINISIKIKHVQQNISSSCIIYHHDHHISRLNISYHIIKHIIKHKTYIIMVIIYHVSYIIMIIIYHHHWSYIMYLAYVSSEIIIRNCHLSDLSLHRNHSQQSHHGINTQSCY